MSIKTFYKDPNATLDYAVDWTDWLCSDNISSVVWIVPSGITESSTSNTSTTATIWLSGGTLGVVYTIVCRITTTAGRIDDRTFYIKIQDK